MEQNYRITIFTTEGVIERDFDKREAAIESITEFKRHFNKLKIAILSEKVKGKWNTVCSIINNSKK